jgi:hypothetical protein
LARNVEICMTDILIQLIEDVGILGSEIASMVVEQFERFEKVHVTVTLAADKILYLMQLCILYRAQVILLM